MTNDKKEYFVNFFKEVREQLSQLEKAIEGLEEIFQNQYVGKEITIVEIDSFFSSILLNRNTSLQDISNSKVCEYSGMFSVKIVIESTKDSIKDLMLIKIKEVEFIPPVKLNKNK